MFSENKFLALEECIPRVIPELQYTEFYFEFLMIISKNSYSLYEELPRVGLSKYRIEKDLKGLKNTSEKWCTYILGLDDRKYCFTCDKVKSLSEFPLNKSRTSGYGICCKECHYIKNKDKQAARTAKYKAHYLERVPKWADLQKISIFYANCPEGYEVDHIVPLQGKLVSGLHVHNNLQYLTKLDNIKKHNKFNGE